MPQPGQRYVAASWIAVLVAAVAAGAGTLALLIVWPDLPDRVALRSTADGPRLYVSPAAAIVVGCAATIGVCLLCLALGLAIHRSPRHRLAGLAAGSAVAVSLLLFGVAWEQSRTDLVDSSPWILAGVGIGFAAGGSLSRWSRPQWSAAERSPQGGRRQSLDVPRSSRLAWVGTCRMSWPGRLLNGALRVVPLLAIYAWMGFLSTLWWLIGIAGLAAMTTLIRDKQVVVDYSGVGIRSNGTAPPPVPMREIRSASVEHVAVPRDFGGWGKVKAPDGREGWITRSGEALVVHRWDKPDFVVTVDDAEEAAAVLNTLVARSEVA